MPDQPVFLVTTAIEDFWEASRPVVFLGDWCRRYSRKKTWEALDGEVLPDLWSERTAALGACEYAEKSYERLLGPLCQALNKLHGTHHAERYWRIVVGPWLQWFTAVLYERYATLRGALDRYPGLSSAGLEEASYVAPTDTSQFIALAKQDGYNLQLYTRVLEHFGVPLRLKPYQIVISEERPPRTDGVPSLRAWIRLLARGPVRAAQRFSALLFDAAHFPMTTQVRLAMESFGRILPIVERYGSSQVTTGPARCADLVLPLVPNDDFESFAAAVVVREIPRSFVEDFGAIGTAVRRGYPLRPRAILSANSWYENEPFKRWAAEAAERGTILLGTQHGGNYGSLDPMPDEDHEIAIVDRYYSWGWQRDGCEAAVVPMPAAKLAGRKHIGANNEKHGILYACTGRPRYRLHFPFTTGAFRDYLEWQARFLASLPETKRQKVTVRLHYEDHGWDIAHRLEERFSGLRFGDWRVPFGRALRQYRMYVGDHLSTTFAEALAADVPSVLFWNPEWNCLRPEAEPYYVTLKSAGVLHETPELAAATVDAVYADVEGWWNEPSRRKARQVFCDRFARTSKRPVQEWMAEFRRVLRSSPGQLNAEARRGPIRAEDEVVRGIEIGTRNDAAARERH